MSNIGEGQKIGWLECIDNLNLDENEKKVHFL